MYDNAAEIVADVLFRGGEPANNSDYATAVVDFLNRAYQGIWQGGAELDPEVSEPWWWLSTYGVLTLNPALATGSISLTNNAIGFTLTGAPTYSVQGWYLKADDHADVFRISSHVSGEATGQLESVYTGDTDTGAAFKIFQTDYSLATTVLYISSPMRAYQDGRRKINYLSNGRLLDVWPRNQIGSGVPHNFSMIGQRSVRFSHYGGATSGDLIKVEYDFLREPGDLSNATTSTPLVPKQYRKILADWTLAFLHEAKNDDRAPGMITLAQRGLKAMARDNQRRMRMMGNDRFAQVIVRQDDLQFRYIEGPLRSESGRLLGF